MKLRRGFKAECERISAENRSELGLRLDERFDPADLAAHLAIPVKSLTVFRANCPTEFNRLTVDDPECFSAAMVFAGTRRVIIYNPVHAAVRWASSVAHELAHVLLEHEPGPVTDESANRRWHPMQEAEANWLGAALLVPRDGALEVMSRLASLEEAAAHFGVSLQLMRWRLNQTGVTRQINRRVDLARS